MRNRRHLRRIPGKQVEQEEEGEEEDDDIQDDLRAPISSSSSGSSSSPSSTGPTSPAKPSVSADPEPVPAQHNPVPSEQSDSSDKTDGIRRSGRSSNPPSRLEVTGNGKSYAAVVSTGFTGKRASVGGKGCGPSVPIRRESVHSRRGKSKAGPCRRDVQHCQRQANGPRGQPYLSHTVPNSAYNLY